MRISLVAILGLLLSACARTPCRPCAERIAPPSSEVEEVERFKAEKRAWIAAHRLLLRSSLDDKFFYRVETRLTEHGIPNHKMRVRLGYAELYVATDAYREALLLLLRMPEVKTWSARRLLQQVTGPADALHPDARSD